MARDGVYSRDGAATHHIGAANGLVNLGDVQLRVAHVHVVLAQHIDPDREALLVVHQRHLVLTDVGNGCVVK